MKLFVNIACALVIGATTLIGMFMYHASRVDWNYYTDPYYYARCGTVDSTPSLVAYTPPEHAAGEALFEANCASCHKPIGPLVGPQLAGVAEKYADDKEWLYKWVKNSSKLIKQGDPKAVALFEYYGKQQMTSFPTLTEEDIDAILEYADAMNY